VSDLASSPALSKADPSIITFDVVAFPSRQGVSHGTIMESDGPSHFAYGAVWFDQVGEKTLNTSPFKR
jgi:hypothetical protein